MGFKRGDRVRCLAGHYRGFKGWVQAVNENGSLLIRVPVMSGPRISDRYVTLLPKNVEAVA